MRELDDTTQLLLRSFIHELRQPVMGLRASLHFVQKKLGQDVTELSDWGIALEQLNRVEQLTRSYQELFLPDRFEPQPFDAASVADKALRLCEHRLREIQCTPEVQIAPDLPPAYGSANALLHALLNLLSNAADAMRKSAPRLLVRIATGPRESVEVRVSDAGPGISDDVRERLFEPGNTNKERGSGLGLFVSRLLLERAEGHLRLAKQSDPKKESWSGAEFVISLAPDPREAT